MVWVLQQVQAVKESAQHCSNSCIGAVHRVLGMQHSGVLGKESVCVMIRVHSLHQMTRTVCKSVVVSALWASTAVAIYKLPSLAVSRFMCWNRLAELLQGAEAVQCM